MKLVFKHQYLQLFGHKLNKYVYVYFHSLEIVSRSCETQLKEGENLNYLI